MSSDAEFLHDYESIKTSYRNAMKQIDLAISHEEQEEPGRAIAAYESCLNAIEQTFAISVGLPDNLDAVEQQWNDACTIIQQLKAAKMEVQYRVKMLHLRNAPVDEAAVEASETNDVNSAVDGAEAGKPSATTAKSVLAENPPTYYDISVGICQTKTYKEIINGLRQVIATKDSGVEFDTLFHSQVKLYKIQANGAVSTIAGDTYMSLVLCTVGGQWQFLNGICFIQCTIPESVMPADATRTDNMIWVYPLLPAITNCYRTDFGAFIFPDMECDVPGSAFGIMLSKPDAATSAEVELSDVEQFFLDLLEAVLAGTVVELQDTQGSSVSSGTSQKVSKHIVTAADFIARNLVRGAEKTGELMIKTTPFIMSKLKPAAPDAPPVSSTVQTSVEVAKNVTSAAAGVTGWVAGKVGSASVALGRYLAPHVHASGAVLLQKGFGYDNSEANSTMDGALTIAAGAVEGFSTVYNGLETSAKILGNNLSENSVRIIEHKYGPSAGNVAAGTFDTLGNAFNVSQNVNYITPKGLAKKMVKNTGKAVVDDYKRSLREESQFVPAGSLYPHLRALKEKSKN